jgi:hypothetical protein
MAQFSTSILVSSAGELSMSPGSEVSFTVSWGNNIGAFRWSRIWPAVLGASDEATVQNVTIVSEGSQWNTPSSNSIAATIRGDSDLGANVSALIQVMASQDDTF